MAFRDRMLPIVDRIRGIPGRYGLRLFTVTVYTREWSGVRAGLGVNTDASAGVKVALGSYQVKVTNLTSREVVASEGKYDSEDLRIGPFTPPYPGSGANGSAINVFEPVVGANPKEIFFNIKGPGHPAAGSWYKKIDQDVTKPFRYSFVVRKTGEVE